VPTLVILIALFGAIDDFSFNGTRFKLSNNPILIRIRWLIIGLALGCLIAQYDIPRDKFWPWAVLLVFLITMVKKKVVPTSRLTSH
jgi:hypothetical protein